MLDAQAASPPRRQTLVDGEFPLSTADFRRIATMLQGDAGIVLHDGKAALVYSRLAKRFRKLELNSFEAYCDLIADPVNIEERRAMLAALTTNVTRFFREPHHFEHLRTAILPPLLQAARHGKRVRIWSAASSSGQEPYSIALTILQETPDAAEFDIRVLATDIDPNMVAAGQAAVFADTLAADIAPEMRRRWFEPAPGDTASLRAGPALRRLVAFKELNLIGRWPMQGRFHAIFCRNVVIYFEEAMQAQLWARMVPLLEPEGVLYIGHSERVSGEATPAFRNDGITTYRLLPGGAGR